MADTNERLIHQQIRDAGGRLTIPTRTVVAILLDHDGHLTAEELIEHTEQRAPGIAPSTVYRVLQRLEELGALEHIHSGHGATFYHLTGQHHIHLHCTNCGTIVDIPERLLTTIAHRVEHDYDFAIDTHHTALIGRCATCRHA
jgi:Fur family transcriptional regulator, ferric uptake regulator